MSFAVFASHSLENVRNTQPLPAGFNAFGMSSSTGFHSKRLKGVIFPSMKPKTQSNAFGKNAERYAQFRTTLLFGESTPSLRPLQISHLLMSAVRGKMPSSCNAIVAAPSPQQISTVLLRSLIPSLRRKSERTPFNAETRSAE
ncbi:MAG: hypothetical protein MW690_001671 [Methanophagales archaeon]|nr:hypothetical protein [Methanophagales archaeon]